MNGKSNKVMGMFWGCFKQNGKCHGMRSLKKISHEKIIHESPIENHPFNGDILCSAVLQ